MTKEEAIKYIEKHADPHGLTWEVTDTFNTWVKYAIEHNEEINFAREANLALMEWDI